ncbi:MAG TPA: hypothetical protein VGR86_07520 [Steroidobacteraceae bacterium]|nr:hypothetical protein [Steroidobacteraceae bacterium]
MAAGWRFSAMRFRSYTLTLVTMIVALACAILIVPLRISMLRAMGRFLVATGQLQHADVIVLSVDSDGAGVLEATDLIHEHVADRVALFADPPDAADREFLRRGVFYHNAATVSVRQLHELGVDAVEVIPRTVAGTVDESNDLAAWCSEHRYSSVVFISTIDHSRRSARILARATRDRGLKFSVRGSRYSDFDPDAWWKSRTGVRTEIIESEKLLADILLHPIS